MPSFNAILHLQIYPHGSTDTLPYATMGSGSLAAMSVFESKYKEGLTVSSCAYIDTAKFEQLGVSYHGDW